MIDVSSVTDLNLGSDFVVFAEPYVWAPLPAEHVALGDTAVSTVQAWLEAAERVIQLNQPTSLDEFREHGRVLQAIVDRSPGGAGTVPAGQLNEIVRSAEEAFIAQIDLLRGLPSAREAATWMWLPDTNALYDRHELHLWPASVPTLLVVAPIVIAELDTHKQDGRNPDRQKKARSLIQQIKDIRRRPDQVIQGRLRLHFTGMWHQRWDVLPNWLDRGHSDDQILALGIELSWTSLRSAVTLVTSDPNLQIKAERVGLAYVDQDQPAVLVAPSAPDPLLGVYRAERLLIYAGFRRAPDDRFLSVDGQEAVLRTHLEQGAAVLS